MSETLGSLALVVGLGTRIAAFGAASTMVGAVLLSHLPNGFFMNWFGNQKGEGFECFILGLAVALPLVINGAGAWSLDRRLEELLRARERHSKISNEAFETL
jgi:putative oxidoreductase